MDSQVPRMHAEAGYEVDETTAPLRVSGFLCLIFGLLSAFSAMGRPMLIFPLIALLTGFFALRKWSGPKPVGIRAAMIGLVLAVGFGMMGLMIPWLKTMTLANQAEKFSRYYIEVVAQGQDEFAMELQKDYVNRFNETMSLKEFYTADDRSKQALEEFKGNTFNELIRGRGPNAQWELASPIRVYYNYQRQKAEVIWQDPTGEVQSKLLFILDYRVDSDGQGQWNVGTATINRDPIVAESIL